MASSARTTGPNFDRIAFVTGAYPRMRATIISAPFVLLVIPVATNLREGDTRGTFGTALLLLTAGPLLGHFVGRWMDGRFGKVIVSNEPTAWHVFAPMLGGLLSGCVNTLDGWALRSGPPSVLMLMLATFGLWMTVRDWPFRKHLLAFAAVCAGSAVWLGEMAHASHLLAWRTRADAAAALAWVMVGVCDFVLLRRVMRRSAGPAEASHA